QPLPRSRGPLGTAAAAGGTCRPRPARLRRRHRPGAAWGGAAAVGPGVARRTRPPLPRLDERPCPAYVGRVGGPRNRCGAARPEAVQLRARGRANACTEWLRTAFAPILNHGCAMTFLTLLAVALSALLHHKLRAVLTGLG